MRLGQWVILLASATNAALFTTPHAATAAEQVRAYVLFELADDTDTAVENLRSSSLRHCKQVLLPLIGTEMILHLECYEERAESTEYLSQEVMQLAGVGGVRRATVLFVKAGSE